MYNLLKPSFHVFLCHQAAWPATSKVRLHPSCSLTLPRWMSCNFTTTEKVLDTHLYWEKWRQSLGSCVVFVPVKIGFTFSMDGVPHEAAGFRKRRYAALSNRVKQVALIHKANKDALVGAVLLNLRAAIQFPTKISCGLLKTNGMLNWDTLKWEQIRKQMTISNKVIIS